MSESSILKAWPSAARAFRNPWGQIVLIDHQGVEHVGVQIIPLFPVTSPNEWISFANERGEELLCLESLDQVPAEIQALIHEELSYREFMPRITKVLSVSGTSEPCEWRVTTDRGETSFVLKSEDDIRRLSTHTVQIIDAVGVRYRVDDTRKLDHHSLRFIEWYV
jgi:PAS domain-containing protein